jgi:hypothetical protein
MKQKILVLTGTILLCGAWAVAQSGAGHAGGSTGTTGGQSTMGTQSQTPGTRPQTTTPGSAMPGASANPNGTNTPGATQPGTMPSVAPTRRLPHLGRPMLRRPSRVPRPTRPLPRPTRPPDRQPPEQLRLPTRKLLLKAVQRQLRRNCRPGASNGTRGSTRLSRCVSENFGLFGSRRLFMPSPSSAVRCAAFRLPSLVPRVLQFVSRFAGTLVLAAHPPQSSDTSCDTFSSSYALPTKS